jgi:hypothetical protein
MGASYSAVLLGLIEPWLLIALLVINPVVFRLWFLRGDKGPARGISGHS